jgi:hypothetical protein
MTDTIHSCSYYCQIPACIKAQRDELREKLYQRTWVGLTDKERLDIRSRVQEYTLLDSVKYGEAIQIATEQALMEKNG